MNIVVINTFMRDLALVERSLRAALKQSDCLEAVYLLDQNQDKLNLSDDISNHSKFHHEKVNATAVSKARNYILNNTNDNVEWIIFCDDDGFLSDNYLSTFVKLVNNSSNLNVIAGSIKRDDNSEFYSLRHQIGGDMKYFRHSKLLMGSNFCIKASTFKELGGFDEEFGVGGKWGAGEETDLAWNVFFHNHQLEYHPELIVYHVKPYQQSFKHSLIKAYKYGIGKGALVGKWLLSKRKVAVCYELLEMLAVPIIQSIRYMCRFKFADVCFNLSSLIGRIIGVLLYLIQLRKT